MFAVAHSVKSQLQSIAQNAYEMCVDKTNWN